MKRLMRSLAVIISAAIAVPCFTLNVHVLASGDIPIDEDHFPDPMFRSVVESSEYDQDGNGILSEYERTHVNNMHCENMGITSIKGIEYFPDITGLWCLNNNISEWDLSGNPNLVGIYCSDNAFTELDLSDCPKLQWLYCFNCNLTSLNLKNNPELAYLECNSNPNLTTLDLSGNPKLENLFCSKCGLTSLDLSGNPLLCELDAFENHLTSIDLSNNTELRRLDIWFNEGLGNVDVSNLSKLQLFNCAWTDCTEIDVTNNHELQCLIAGWNEELKTLDLSGNPKLADLRIDCDWRLTSLDISHNPKLYYVLAYGLHGIPLINIGNNTNLLNTYNRGYVQDEPQLGDIHSYTIEYGGSDEYFEDLTHCLCVDNGKTIVTSGQPDSVPDCYINEDDGHGSGDRFVTRGEAIKYFYDMTGNPDIEGISRFTDVAGTPYADAVRWGETVNICFGYPNISSGKFCPDELISREDFALMAHRYAIYIGAGSAFDYGRTDWFDDALDIDYYGWGAFTWAIQFEVLKPFGNYCYPHGRVTDRELEDGFAQILDLDEAASYSARVGGNGPGTEGAAEIVYYADKTTGSEGSGNNSETPKPTTAPSTPTPAIPTSSPYTPDQPSETGVSGFVERLYTVALNRPSEPSGKKAWIDAITLRGETGASAARGFLLSREFLNKECTHEEFVAVLYRTFFDREPDQAGFNAWVGVLRNGVSKEEVIEGFINSTEWANLCLRYGIRSGGTGIPDIEIEPNQETINFATRLYTTCLCREADVNGLMAWARQLANQRDSGTGAAHGFFFSKEFLDQNVSNEEYVTRLYRTFMDREPEKAGFDAWVAQLYSGVSREEVFRGFAHSVEFAKICASYGIVVEL